LRRPSGPAWSGALPAAAGALSAVFTWQRWINPFVDSSREMIVPARVAAGERLYRDVVYHYGPAGPWLNALALKLFGRRFAVLEIVGALFAILLLAALADLTRRAGSARSAVTAATLAAAICVGAPNGGAFLFPYSFGALYALAGGWLALAASQSRSRLSALLCAGGLALSLTAKPEIGAAACAVLAAGALRASDNREQLRHASKVLGAAAAASAAAYAFAFFRIPGRDLSPEGPFALFSPPKEWRNVYRLISGFDDPAGAAGQVSTAAFLAALLLGSAAALAWLQDRRPGSARALGALWIVAVCAATAWLAGRAGSQIEDRLPPLLSPLPLLAAGAALWLVRRPLDPQARAKFFLFAFSAATGARVLLGLAYGSRTTPYSILVFPGLAATAAVLCLDVLSRRVAGAEDFRRNVAAVFLGMAALGLLRLARFTASSPALTVHTAAGSLRLPVARAVPVAQTLEFLSQPAHAGGGLSGFPETGFFNFATGQPNPLREDQVLPGHLTPGDEERVIQRIERSGPRFILLANQPSAAFGPVSFGKDYAVSLWAEVERRYRLAASFGASPSDAPVGDPRFFIRIYERAASP
jgi:hypothetical protein